MIQRVAIAIIKNPKGDVLMGKRGDSGKWTFPAGGIDKGECPFVAVKREVKEEAGLDVVSCKLVKVEKSDKVLLYLFECSVTGEIDHTKDPDAEYCQKPEYCNPVSKYKDLHIPVSKNIAFKYLLK